ETFLSHCCGNGAKVVGKDRGEIDTSNHALGADPKSARSARDRDRTLVMNPAVRVFAPGPTGWCREGESINNLGSGYTRHRDASQPENKWNPSPTMRRRIS